MNEIHHYADPLAIRKLSLEIFEDVMIRHQALDQILENKSSFKTLSIPDRAFVRMLVTTAIRRLGQCDDIIRRATDRKDPPSPPSLQSLLRLGITQLVFMDVPDHAACDLSVDLAGVCGLSKQKGFVNAVMRRVAREGREWTTRQDTARLNIAPWLMEKWILDYSLKAAIDIAQASQLEAPLDITLKQPDQIKAWAETLQATILPTGSLRRYQKGPVIDLPGFLDGMWWIQDASASLPVQLFGDLSGKHVVDLCAAPGGKTAQLAAAGARVDAVDRAAGRMRLLMDNMERLRLSDRVQTHISDAALWQPRAQVDAVLADVPCSATGTLRRHPDVGWLKGPRDIETLVDVQARILDNAANILKPEGVLIYCTCSLQKAEGEDQITAFLERRRDFSRASFHLSEVKGITECINRDGDIRLMPQFLAKDGGLDGFFISRLVKT